MLVAASRRKRLLAALAVNLACLLALAGYVASMSVPASEATRLRNALIIQPGAEADFDWTPDTVPASFKAEHRPASERLQKAVEDLRTAALPSDWDKALVLADHLSRNAQDKGPIQSSVDAAYEDIVERGKGYCADFTQVYLGLAHAAGLFAREWAFSVDGFGGDGHAFIEVFDRQRGRWVWLDVYNNVHAIDDRTGEPASAQQFRRFATGGGGSLVIRPNGPGRLGYKHTDKLIEYYRRGADQWYLWWGNAVFTYDRDPLVRIGQRILPAVGQLTAIALGEHPKMMAMTDERNAAMLARMAQLRSVLLAVCIVGVLLLASLVYLLWRLVQGRTRASAHGRRPGIPAC